MKGSRLLFNILLIAAGLCGFLNAEAQELNLPKVFGDNMVMPVSYTHLRAHETVLDLVCRLLLEKKKKDKT